MNHGEYIRVSEDNKTAILMIHGIAGTPDHFRDLYRRDGPYTIFFWRATAKKYGISVPLR